MHQNSESLPINQETGVVKSKPVTKKDHQAFRTIGEVAETLEVQQHVLRFWETKFSQIKPLKRGGGRRYYRPEDVELLGSIKDLLHTQGYTIKGVQKLLKTGGKAALLGDKNNEQNPPANSVAPISPAVKAKQNLSQSQRAALSSVLSELRALKAAIA